MKCPKCGFHSYAYDNCKKCGAELGGAKGKRGHQAVPPKLPQPPVTQKKTEEQAQQATRPLAEKKSTPAKPPVTTSPQVPAPQKAVSVPAEPEDVEETPSSEEKIGWGARLRARFMPERDEEAVLEETTLEEPPPAPASVQAAPAVKPQRAPQPKPTSAPGAPSKQPKQAAQVAPTPTKKVRRKSAPPKRSPAPPPQPQRRSVPLLEETDTFAQGLDDLPDIVSVTPLPREERKMEGGQVLVEGEESVNLVQRAKESVGRLLSRFSRESEVEEDEGFSLAEPPEDSAELPSRPDEEPVSAPLPTPAPVTSSSRPPLRKQPSRSLGKTAPEFTIDAEIEPLNTSPQNVRQKPSLLAGKALPPLPTSYNSLPPSSFTTGDSLPPLSSSHGDGGLPPLPAASVLPTIITATLEEKKPSSGDEDDDSDLDTATIDPFADDE